jgi:hypothetical protein
MKKLSVPNHCYKGTVKLAMKDASKFHVATFLPPIHHASKPSPYNIRLHKAQQVLKCYNPFQSLNSFQDSPVPL